MEYIEARTILMKTKTREWFGTDYTMNVYKGCHHGCVYCDSRSECYQIDQFDQVRGKTSASQLLNQELQSKRQKGVVGAGSMSDPYNYFERQELLTRQSLELFNHHGFGVSLATKSELVTRDIDLFQALKIHSPVAISLSFCTVDEQLGQKLERYVSPPSKRLSALEKLSAAGIYTGVMLMPVLPYLTDSWPIVESVIKSAYERGARYVYPLFGMTLRDRQRDYYFAFLKKYYPEKLRLYKKVYDNQYYCQSPNHQKLEQRMKELCDKLNVSMTMSSIIRDYQEPYQVEQGQLF
ncbi:radical SAM protein [uncultured Vagococcus sp.]|uniref:SPL family radical SAM protein n=1 Tax=uncultured Vagococcus sp. TaxID=189676 RepID=UPI0028D588A9|nr:radical SAM protein [uncultured Vagococcus sp.]